MKLSVALIAAVLIFAGCNKKEETAAAKPTNAASTGNPITAPVDYLGAVAKAKKHSESTLDLISVNQAITMFSSEEGRLPKSLDELVTEKYLPRLPAAPYGQKFRYDPATGKVSLVPSP